MPSTTLILNGFNLIDDVKVKVKPHGGFQNGGQVDVTGGSLPFEPDDIIVIHIDNADANFEVTRDSLIMGLTVYDSAADYYNGTVKYDYTAADSGGINIRANTSGLGDRHMRFNGNGLVSSDPNAPDLSQVMVGAGIDFSAVEAGQTVTIDVLSDNDYNADSTINPGTTEVANGNFATENNIFSGVVCFARGTLIDAPGGPRAVETLARSDLVNTLDRGAQPIRWIGSCRVAADGANAPIRIRAGALGNVRDLLVSPNHRMLVRGPMAELHYGHSEVLVAAKHLVDGTSVTLAPMAEVEYFHFICPKHEIVFAEACPAESMFLGREALNTVGDEAQAEILDLFPECRRLATAGPIARYALSRPEAQVWRMAAA